MHRFQPWQLTILADDLHSRQPFCAVLVDAQMHFILTYKPESQPTLYAEIALLAKIDGLSGFSLTNAISAFAKNSVLA